MLPYGNQFRVNCWQCNIRNQRDNVIIDPWHICEGYASSCSLCVCVCYWAIIHSYNVPCLYIKSQVSLGFQCSFQCIHCVHKSICIVYMYYDTWTLILIHYVTLLVLWMYIQWVLACWPTLQTQWVLVVTACSVGMAISPARIMPFHARNIVQ